MTTTLEAQEKSFLTMVRDDLTNTAHEEHPDFVPTTHELRTLARHWFTFRLRMQLYWVGIYEDISVRETLLYTHAGERLSRMWDLLGEEAMRLLEMEVESTLEQEIGSESWRAFQQLWDSWS
jgi:hypothetical protein